MEELARTEPAARRPSSAADGASGTAPGLGPDGGPPHLADPRALAVLSTEHWGLLTARSLVYNEAFARSGTFLTFLSASLVALGFVYQGGAGPDFLVIAVAILGLDLFIGLATAGRLIACSTEEFRALQGINRVRHAYLEMVPGVAPYLPGSGYDDLPSILAVYGASSHSTSPLRAIAHGLTTVTGMVAVIDSALAGGITSVVAAWLGAEPRAAFILGLAGAGIAMVCLFGFQMRAFTRHATTLDTRFPPPGGRA